MCSDCALENQQKDDKRLEVQGKISGFFPQKNAIQFHANFK